MSKFKNIEKPIMEWSSNEPFDNECRVIWWSRLDGKYQVEVQRTGDRQGRLLVFEHSNLDKLIYGKDVNLSYGAMFGPDVSDVAYWQRLAMDVVDGKTKANEKDAADLKATARKNPKNMTEEEKLEIREGIKQKLEEEKKKYSGTVKERELFYILKLEKGAMIYEAAGDLYSAALWYEATASSVIYTLKNFGWAEELLLSAESAVKNCPPEKNRGNGFGSAEEDIYYTRKRLEDLKKLSGEELGEIISFLQNEDKKYEGTMPVSELDQILSCEQLAICHIKLTEKIYKNNDPSGFAPQNFVFAAERALENGNKEWANVLAARAEESISKAVPGPQYETYYFPNLKQKILDINAVCSGTKTVEEYMEEERRKFSS